MKDLKKFIKTTIREFLNENDNTFKLNLNDKNLSKVIERISKFYNCSIEDINNGECDNFAVEVAEYFFGEDTTQTLFFRELNGFKLVTYGNYSKFDDELDPHTWIFYNGKHYDSETPNGVESYYDLPIYKRQFKDKTLNETYSEDKDEIIEFLNDLPEEITLYRGLIVPKEKKTINKKSLGVHWSLDEYFVKNMFEYDTFRIYDREDYNLWFIEAVFNKSDIDFEGTIDKRIIKDSGFFWDELTGEMIENDSDGIKQHPYSHENEILVKPNSTPKIIKIEKIKL